MLLTREEMTFDFGEGRLDPVADKDMVEWMLNQFLYGEMTGIQIGHWLFEAPDVDAAKFLARQAVEEMQHVDNFLRMMSMMDMKPAPAHGMVRFLATGMMGQTWHEHVALEMAAGEGFVLLAFYALIDTLDHKPSVDILKRAVKQEERHVEFGEQQTMRATEGNRGRARRLVGLNLVSMWGVSRLAKFMGKRLPKDHELMKHLPEFLEHANRCAELRLLRMGLIDRPLAKIGRLKRAAMVAEAYAAKIPSLLFGIVKAPFKWIAAPLRDNARLTDSYLDDPHIVGFRDLTRPKQSQARARNSAA